MEGGGAEDFILLFKEEGRRIEARYDRKIGRMKEGKEEKKEEVKKEGN